MDWIFLQSIVTCSWNEQAKQMTLNSWHIHIKILFQKMAWKKKTIFD